MASSHLDGTSLLAAINGTTSRNYVVVELDKDRAVVTSKCTPVAETALECHSVAALTQPSVAFLSRLGMCCALRRRTAASHHQVQVFIHGRRGSELEGVRQS